MSQSTCNISFLVEQVRLLPGPLGISPYTVFEINVEGYLKELLEVFTSVNLDGFPKAIGVMEWIDYNNVDLSNHLKFSEEFSNLHITDQPAFLAERTGQLSDPFAFATWKAYQAKLAIESIMASAKQGCHETIIVPAIFNNALSLRIHKLPNHKLYQLILVGDT